MRGGRSGGAVEIQRMYYRERESYAIVDDANQITFDSLVF